MQCPIIARFPVLRALSGGKSLSTMAQHLANLRSTHMVLTPPMTVPSCPQRVGVSQTPMTSTTVHAWPCPSPPVASFSSQSSSMRQLRRKMRHLNPTQFAAALADPDIDMEAPQQAQQSPNDVDEEEPFLEQADPFAPQAAKAAGKPRGRRLGVLQSVPVIAPAHEHLGSALKRASKVVPSATIKNEAEKERNRAARQMDTLMKELSVPLSKYVGGFPNPDKLHPFDAALLQLTVSTNTYRSVLGKVDSLRKSLQTMGKSFANRASNAPNKQTAVAVALEGVESMESVYRNGSRHVEDLKEIAKKLRGLPVLEVGLPTLALVGAPNVGKSSLVQVLSSGTPEICNYPFTTRSIKMGHFFLDGRKHQVTDTPGLLARPDEERNKMELLTLAALQYLPTSVLFVMDLTEECGTSVQDQWAIREEVRARFPEKDWIDVFSKADMLGDVFQQAQSLSANNESQSQHTDRPDVHTGQDAGAQGAGPEGGEGVQVHEEAALTPVQLAARLPNALRVSSTTKQGIPKLQGSIVRMFQRQQEQAKALSLASEATPAEL